MDEEKATTGSSTYHIDKLTETNYRSWSQQIRWILDERDLLELVEGTEQMPQPPVPPAQGSATTTETQAAQQATATKEAQAAYQQDLAAWNKKCKKARSIIGSAITTSVMVYIDGTNNPADMWRILREKYSPKTQTTLLQTFIQFIETKMDDGA